MSGTIKEHESLIAHLYDNQAENSSMMNTLLNMIKAMEQDLIETKRLIKGEASSSKSNVESMTKEIEDDEEEEDQEPLNVDEDGKDLLGENKDKDDDNDGEGLKIVENVQSTESELAVNEQIDTTESNRETQDSGKQIEMVDDFIEPINMMFNEEYEVNADEFVESYSENEVAKMFEMDVEKVFIENRSVPDDNLNENIFENADGYDEVEVEDGSDEEEIYVNDKNEDLPTFNDLHKQAADDILKKKETTTSSVNDNMSKEEWKKLKETWFRIAEKNPAKPPRQLKFFTQDKHLSKGEIISWKFVQSLNIIAIKRRFGMQYFKHINDIQTLPHWDIRILISKKLIDGEQSNYCSWFIRQITYESRTKWKNFKPQFPKRMFYEKKKNKEGNPLVALVYKKPKVMKKIPLMKMEQDICNQMRWWYYNGKSGEAVIVLGEDKGWKTVKIYDPMWIINLSRSDIEKLYLNPLLFRNEDRAQAEMFENIVLICFCHGIHSGSDWKSKWKKLDKKP